MMMDLLTTIASEKKLLSRGRLWRLLLALLIAIPAALLPAPARFETAGGGLVSDVVPFLGIISGLRARNRIYRTANAYINEKRDYYDRLRAKALEQLQSKQVGGLRRSQVAAFVKVTALIEGERQQMIDFAESEKRGARREFIDRVEQTIINRVLATNAVTRVLGALGGGVRSSKGLIDRALDELSGGGSGALADVQRIRSIATRVSTAGSLIGGSAGKTIRSIGSRIVETLDRPTQQIEAGLGQVRSDLDELGAAVSELQGRAVQPTASQVMQEAAITVVTGDEADPAVEAIVNLLVGKIGAKGG
ncbi:MAG: hypothetical protein E4G99_12700, partial [Anaerolineales bacterium]